MSMQPPPPERSQVGDVWVDPMSGHRFVFTGDTSAPAANLTKQRHLHPTWVEAGNRRRISRALRAADYSYAEIGRLLGCSHETARKDCAE